MVPAFVSYSDGKRTGSDLVTMFAQALPVNARIIAASSLPYNQVLIVFRVISSLRVDLEVIQVGDDNRVRLESRRGRITYLRSLVLICFPNSQLGQAKGAQNCCKYVF
jgi:hypothetical protein